MGLPCLEHVWVYECARSHKGLQHPDMELLGVFKQGDHPRQNRRRGDDPLERFGPVPCLKSTVLTLLDSWPSASTQGFPQVRLRIRKLSTILLLPTSDFQGVFSL